MSYEFFQHCLNLAIFRKKSLFHFYLDRRHSDDAEAKSHDQKLRTVSGRFRVGVRYSSHISYNTFPVPKISTPQREALEEHAWDIIGARDAHPGKTITWLYDPSVMPENLVNAHKALDDTVDKIYIGRPFKSDTERLEHLFNLYAEMTSGKLKEAANA